MEEKPIKPKTHPMKIQKGPCDDIVQDLENCLINLKDLWEEFKEFKAEICKRLGAFQFAMQDQEQWGDAYVDLSKLKAYIETYIPKSATYLKKKDTLMSEFERIKVMDDLTKKEVVTNPTLAEKTNSLIKSWEEAERKFKLIEKEYNEAKKNYRAATMNLGDFIVPSNRRAGYNYLLIVENAFLRITYISGGSYSIGYLDKKEEILEEE